MENTANRNMRETQECMGVPKSGLSVTQHTPIKRVIYLLMDVPYVASCFNLLRTL